MRSRFQAIAVPSELGDFSDEVRAVFHELGRLFGSESLVGECSPALDVHETDDTLEITVDLPGVEASAIRVLAKGDSILVAGEKAARRVRGESSFHLVERGYGPFARVVRRAGPSDPAKAHASRADGELRISIPKIGDRRGRAVPIAVSVRADG